LAFRGTKPYHSFSNPPFVYQNSHMVTATWMLHITKHYGSNSFTSGLLYLFELVS